MRKSLLIISILASIVLVFALTLYIRYGSYISRQSEQPPYFDFFIGELIFDDTDGSPWDYPILNEIRPIKWNLKKSEFETMDSVTIELENISDEKFYYITWGEPFSRLRNDLIVFKNGIADSIPFNGFGCATGIFLHPIQAGGKIEAKFMNPLLFDPYSGRLLTFQKDRFSHKYKEIYGDSVAIKFKQATYGNPWSKYPSQMIESEYLVINTEKLLNSMILND